MCSRPFRISSLNVCNRFFCCSPFAFHFHLLLTECYFPAHLFFYLSRFVLFDFIVAFVFVPRTNLRAVCVCVFGLQSFIFLVIFFSLCFVSIQNCGCHATLVLRLVYFIFIEFTMRACDYTQRIVFFSLSLRIASDILFIIIKANSFKCMKMTVFTHIIVMLGARRVLIQWNLHTA